LSAAAQGRKLSEKTKAKIKAGINSIIFTSEHKKKLLNHLKVMHSNKELQAKRLEKVKTYHKSKEFQEHVQRQSTIIEVFDLLNNKTTVYSSINQAAR